MSNASKNIRVVVRVRPPNTRELEQNQRTIVKCDTQRTLIFDPDEEEDEFFFHGAKQFHRDITRKQNKKLPMEFDEIFDDTSVNADVFEAAMKPLVRSVMDGFNCSAFVYGATGAGKTHTMLGNEAQPGITYLTMAYLFECMDALSTERKFDIGISYLEVYNEQVMNLLSKSGPLKLREDAGGVVVGGLRLLVISSAEELLNLLALGNKNRTQHPTDANAESSRSHAIFQVHIRMVSRTNGTKNTVKLSMIDLAGSERAASTKGIGIRFKEGASINKSLLALGNCINKLADGAKHIPYRDSNLTRIIKDSLGGNCQTVMIANVSPSSLTYEDTYNTLKYASRAKKIRSSATLNICKNNIPMDVLMKQMGDQHSEILALREKVRLLEARVAEAESSPKTAQLAAAATKTRLSGADLTAALQPWYERIDELYRAMGNLMQCSLRIDSKDKVAKFRTEIRQHADSAMMNLVLDGNSVKADIAWTNSTVDRNAKQPDCHEQITLYRQRVTEKKLELKKLQREIAESSFADQLKRYLAGKEHEFDAVKKDYKNLHVLKINQIYYSEVQHLLSVLKLSNQIIMDDYYLLRDKEMIDINMHENLERLKRLGRGRRDATKFANGIDATPAAVSVASAALAAACTNDEGVGDAMDRFNITMADHCADSAADDDNDDDDHNDNDGYVDDDEPLADGEPVRMNTTVSIVPSSAMRRRSRSMTSAEPPAKKPVKKLFKADSFNVRNAVMSKSGASAGRPGSGQMPLPPRASVHVSSASALRGHLNGERSGGGGGDAMDVDDTTYSSLNAKGALVQSKSTMLRGILKDTSGTALYQKAVLKMNPNKAPVPTTKIIATLNKENKRNSPVRVSPRTKVLPRQNNASRVRQRMLTSSLTPSGEALLKNKFKIIPSK